MTIPAGVMHGAGITHIEPDLQAVSRPELILFHRDRVGLALDIHGEINARLVPCKVEIRKRVTTIHGHHIRKQVFLLPVFQNTVDARPRLPMPARNSDIEVTGAWDAFGHERNTKCVLSNK